MSGENVLENYTNFTINLVKYTFICKKSFYMNISPQLILRNFFFKIKLIWLIQNFLRLEDQKIQKLLKIIFFWLTLFNKSWYLSSCLFRTVY